MAFEFVEDMDYAGVQCVDCKKVMSSTFIGVSGLSGGITISEKDWYKIQNHKCKKAVKRKTCRAPERHPMPDY